MSATAPVVGASSHAGRILVRITGLALLVLGANHGAASTLSVSFAAVPAGSVVDLTAIGTRDWVHWGLFTETSLDRKANVVPQISDFTLLDATNGFAFVYQYADNYNGYSWSDGTPVQAVNNTPTGVWAYGTPNLHSGFQISVPCDTVVRTLRVYVGVFGGVGKFEAALSDGSAPDYNNATLQNRSNGPGRVYSLQYAADSPGQTLIVKWTLSGIRDPAANVTLQSATLSAPGGNSPPIVRLLTPTQDQNIAGPSTITVSAAASDPDGQVQQVEFYNGDLKIGEASTAPYSISWPDVAPGRYLLTATATDNARETTTSPPVEILVYKTGGNLTGSGKLPLERVDLSAEGTADWIHWGLSPSNIVNRKAAVAPQISGLTLIGTTNLEFYADNFTSFSWNDGTPTPVNSGATRGVFVYGGKNGFEITAPADSISRRLRVYAGLYGAQGHFRAWLSDFSAPAFHSHSLSNAVGNDYEVYTLDYAAAEPGQTLTVQYTAESLYDADFGNVTIQAATLQGGGPVVHPVVLLNPTRLGSQFWFSFLTDTGYSYRTETSSVLGSGTPWDVLTTLSGTGGIVSVTNQNAADAQRFYRVLRQ